MPPARIVAEYLSKAFSSGQLLAIHDVCLEVADQEALCLVGPSGCGKTTLLRILDGLTACDRGRVLINGETVVRPRLDVAMVFQHFGLFPWKTVQENVAYGLRLRGRSKKETAQVVERYVGLVGLEGFEHRYPYQLSGGMQQRAGLARALAVNPEILLMDEPFGSLDAQTREVMQGELLRIWEQDRKTMVFITHDIDEAIVLGDRIAVMEPRPGRIREIVEVDIPRPRDLAVVRSDPRYVPLRTHIWDLLRLEAEASSRVA